MDFISKDVFYADKDDSPSEYLYFGYEPVVRERGVVNAELVKPVLTEKQWAILNADIMGWLNPVLFFEGSVSSGKTFLQCVWLGMVAQTCGLNDLILIAGYSLTTIDANVCQLLKYMWGRHFKYTSPKGKASLFGINVEFRGASDIRAEDSIRGVTINVGLIDEANICDKNFVAMFMTRLRAKNSRATLGVNPDAPGHWIYKEYADKGDDIGWSCFHFTMDDNTFLTEEYKSNMRRMFTGVFYERFILGKRVAAEGALYPSFAEHEKTMIRRITKEDYENMFATTIGLDFGGSISKTALSLTGINNQFNKFYVLDEELIDSKKIGVQVFVDAIKAMYDRAVVKPTQLLYDNNETVLGNTIRDMLWNDGYVFGVDPCIKEPTNNRLWFNNMLIESDALVIADHCIEYINSMRGAVYDRNGERMDVGITNPFNVDIQDSVEYTYQPYADTLKYGILGFMTDYDIREKNPYDFSHLFK